MCLRASELSFRFCVCVFHLRAHGSVHKPVSLFVLKCVCISESVCERVKLVMEDWLMIANECEWIYSWLC